MSGGWTAVEKQDGSDHAARDFDEGHGAWSRGSRLWRLLRVGFHGLRPLNDGMPSPTQSPASRMALATTRAIMKIARTLIPLIHQSFAKA